MFELSTLTCQGCGAAAPPARWKASCPMCSNSAFAVEIERAASGIDEASLVPWLVGGSVGLTALVHEATDDASPGLYFRTHSLLQCRGVEGAEVAEFLGASLEDRKRLYIGWKRREVEGALDADHRICGRCKVSYKAYANGWNRAGFCSQICFRADTKAR